jgi:hypothetical protein
MAMKFTTSVDALLQMPEEVNVLAAEASQLRCDWETFEQLFFNQEGSSLTQKNAPDFFDELFRTFSERLILGIARFTDPKKSAGQENLVLDSLFVGKTPPKELAELKTLVGKIRLLRHKTIGHLALEGVKTPDKLSEVPFSDIKQAIALIVKIIEPIWEKHAKGSFPSQGRSSGIQILNCLKKAQAYDLLEEHRVAPENFWNYPKEMVENYLVTLGQSRKNS